MKREPTTTAKAAETRAVETLAREAAALSLALLRLARSANMAVKTFLSVLGRNQDELQGDLLEQVNAVLPPDLQPRELVARIKAALDRP